MTYLFSGETFKDTQLFALTQFCSFILQVLNGIFLFTKFKYSIKSLQNQLFFGTKKVKPALFHTDNLESLEYAGTRQSLLASLHVSPCACTKCKKRKENKKKLSHQNISLWCY